VAHSQTDQPIAPPSLREVEQEIEERRESHERSIAAAQRRLQELHQRARAATERLRLAKEAKPGSREVEVEQPADRHEEHSLPVPEEKHLKINEVTAEELHLEGLSVIQAIRFVAQRDRMGGFRSIDDVEQIEGIPYDTLLDIKTRSTA
jgi:DNA uptake protein ComE-like DNA-binding protein